MPSGGCRVYSGCCGFPFSRRRYYQSFRVVEVQQTFYDPPRRELLEKWRAEAPQEFTFHVKAWQLVTHPYTSPTWRRLKRRELPGIRENYGFLRPSEENKWAWKVTLEAAEALKARVIVLQTPPSLPATREAEEWITRFLSWAVREAERIGALVGWEPRGQWAENMEALRRILCSLGVIHIVDPFRRKPVICPGQELLYFRLHGRGGREVNYRYKYTENDHIELAGSLQELLAEHPNIAEAHVLFNNIYMARDAEEFRETARRIGLEAC